MTGVTCMMAGAGGSPPPVVFANDASGFSPSAGFVVTNTPGTTVTNGTAPFTYAWTYRSGSLTPAISSTTAQNPTWSATLPATTLVTAVWRVTATDALGRTSFADINVTLETA